jgi:hypothetical protein
MNTKLGVTAFFATQCVCLPALSSWCLPPCSLQHSRTRSVVSGCVFRQRETNFSISRNPVISTSTDVCACHVSFSSVNYCVVYSCCFGFIWKWSTLYKVTFILEISQSRAAVVTSPIGTPLRTVCVHALPVDGVFACRSLRWFKQLREWLMDRYIWCRKPRVGNAVK